MNKFLNDLNENSFKLDEFGRVIIDNPELSNAINGAAISNLSMMMPDVACGNQNCAC